MRTLAAAAVVGLGASALLAADHGATPPVVARVRAAASMPRSIDEGAWSRLPDQSIATPAWVHGGVDGVSVKLPALASGDRALGLGRVRRFQVAVTLEGAAPVAAAADGDSVVYARAFPSTDVVVLSDRAAYEESWVLHDPEAPTTFTWRLSLGSGYSSVASRDGALLLLDRRGRAVLEIPRPFVVDAKGVRRAVPMTWDGERVRFSVPASGLTYPLVVDPGLVEAAAWTQLSPPSPLAPRAGHGMAWDEARQVAVVFGGVSTVLPGVNGYVGDVAEWAHDHWYFRSPQNAPADRAMSPLVFVPGQGILVANGQTAGGNAFSDLYRLDVVNDTWVKLFGLPPKRSGHGFVFHGARGKAVFVGGGPVNGNALIDWYSLTTSNSWVSEGIDGPALRDSMVVYMDVDKKVHMFGGRNCQTGACPSTADTWELGPTGGWDQVSSGYPGVAPSPRHGMAAAYDLHRKRTVVFGGMDSNVRYDETYELSGTRWYKRTVQNPPSPRGFAAMAYDTVDKRMILFGGNPDAGEPDQSMGSMLGDVWAYTASSAACTTDGQCDTGHCVDGACCEVAACGPCETCGAPTDPGYCVPVVSAPDLDSCAEVCDATGKCPGLTPDGGAGGSGGGGVGGSAGTSGAGGVAGTGGAGGVAGMSGAAGAPLDAGVDACDQPDCKLPPGASCTTDSDCASSQCNGGACCMGSCKGDCTTCASPTQPGVCTIVPKGMVSASCSMGCDGERANCPQPMGQSGAAGAAGAPGSDACPDPATVRSPSGACVARGRRFDLATPSSGCAAVGTTEPGSFAWVVLASMALASRRRRAS